MCSFNSFCLLYSTTYRFQQFHTWRRSLSCTCLLYNGFIFTHKTSRLQGDPDLERCFLCKLNLWICWGSLNIYKYMSLTRKCNHIITAFWKVTCRLIFFQYLNSNSTHSHHVASALKFCTNSLLILRILYIFWTAEGSVLLLFSFICSSGWISEDSMPSYGHLLSSWSTGG